MAELAPMNPAGRLLVFLNRAVSMSGNTHHVIAQALGLQAETNAAIVRRLGQMMEMPDAIAADLAKIGEHDHVYHEYREPLATAMSAIVPALYGDWVANVRGRFTGEMFVALKAANTALRHELVSVDLGPTRQLIDDITAFQTALIADKAELAEPLLTFLLHHTERIRKALIDYEVFGANPVNDAIFSCVGELALREDIRASASTTETGRSSLSRLGRLMFSVIAFVGNIAQISQGATVFFPELAPGTHIEFPNSIDNADCE